MWIKNKKNNKKKPDVTKRTLLRKFKCFMLLNMKESCRMKTKCHTGVVQSKNVARELKIYTSAMNR